MKTSATLLVGRKGMEEIQNKTLASTDWGGDL